MLSHTTRILRTILHHHPLPRFAYARVHSSLANRDVLTDDDYVPYATSDGALGPTGWTPPPAEQVANEWSLEWGGGLADGEQHPLEGESVNKDKVVLGNGLTELHTGGGGKLRTGGKRPAVMEKKRLKILKRLEAEEGNKSRQKLIDVSGDAYMHGKRKYNPLYKKPWDPKFKKVSPNPHNVSITEKEHKPRPHKRKYQNPNLKKSASDTQDTTDPDVLKQRKKKETKPQLDKKTHPPAPKGASPTDPTTDPASPTHKRTRRGRRRSAVFNRTSSAPQHPQTPRRPHDTQVRAEPKPRDPTRKPRRKPRKWKLPAIEAPVFELTPLQKHIASRPRNEVERWKVEKALLHVKLRGAQWDPKKKFSPEALDSIRAFHAKHPENGAGELAKLFEVSPEAMRRILKSKWRPDFATREDRMARWERRGVRLWQRWVDMGVVFKKRRKRAQGVKRQENREQRRIVLEEMSPRGEKKDNIVKEVRSLSKRIM